MLRTFLFRSCICKTDIFSDFALDDDRRAVVEDVVGTWAFSAHDFTDDELVYGALVMLKHALAIPELEKWSMTEGRTRRIATYLDSS